MKILALEFSTRRRSAALWRGPEDAQQIVEETEPGAQPGGAFALLDRLLQGQRDVDLLAVGLGPGSYTGIRAALAMAQGWHLSLNVPVRGVSSMAALALEVEAAEPFHVVVDAQRGEFYLATYEGAGGREREPLRLATAAEVKTLLAEGRLIYGPDLPETLAGAVCRYPSAVAVARLAASAPEGGPVEVIEPIYLRPVSFVKQPPGPAPRQR